MFVLVLPIFYLLLPITEAQLAGVLQHSSPVLATPILLVLFISSFTCIVHQPYEIKIDTPSEVVIISLCP